MAKTKHAAHDKKSKKQIEGRTRQPGHRRRRRRRSFRRESSPSCSKRSRSRRRTAASVVLEVEGAIGDNVVRTIAMDATDGFRRGDPAHATGGPISVPVGVETLGRMFNVIGAPIDDEPAPEGVTRWPIHRPAPPVSRAAGQGRDPRDGHQGHRPDLHLRQGLEDRAVRRRRHGQDRHRAGADPQHRLSAQGPLGVRRRGRAHARRQRHVSRDAGRRRAPADRPRVRSDERAAGRARARRPDRPDHGRVLPRRRGRGHAAVHRQHLSLPARGLRGVGAARPHAVRRRLPADAGDRDGRAAGAHHLDQQGLDHLGAGRLRAGRRLHRPRHPDGVRPPRRDSAAGAVAGGDRHLSRHRSRSVPRAGSSSRRSSGRSTTTRRRA